MSAANKRNRPASNNSQENEALARTMQEIALTVPKPEEGDIEMASASTVLDGSALSIRCDQQVDALTIIIDV
eukprot:4048214-Amphidinium_carterae.1